MIATLGRERRHARGYGLIGRDDAFALQSVECLRESLFGLEHGLRRIARDEEESCFDATAQQVAYALLFAHELLAATAATP